MKDIARSHVNASMAFTIIGLFLFIGGIWLFTNGNASHLPKPGLVKSAMAIMVIGAFVSMIGAIFYSLYNDDSKYNIVDDDRDGLGREN